VRLVRYMLILFPAKKLLYLTERWRENKIFDSKL
jgi:hypothetical protein